MAAPTTGPSTQPAPPTMTASRKQDRLRERKRIRRDEHEQRREDRAGKPRERRRQRKGSRLDDHRIEPDGAGGDLGIAHRDHATCPRRCSPADGRKATKHPASSTASTAISRSANTLPSNAGRLEIHQAVVAAGQLAPFDRAVLDDEGERDRHHGEIGPGDAQRRQRERKPIAPASTPASGNAIQKSMPFIVRIAAA